MTHPGMPTLEDLIGFFEVEPTWEHHIMTFEAIRHGFAVRCSLSKYAGDFCFSVVKDGVELMAFDSTTAFSAVEMRAGREQLVVEIPSGMGHGQDSLVLQLEPHLRVSWTGGGLARKRLA